MHLFGHGGHVEVKRGALVAVCVLGTISAAPDSEAQVGSNLKKPPTVLFMCPRGAAKSVVASAYFQRLAKERGLNVRVESAGTEPDPRVSPVVAAHLSRNGYSMPVSTPRKVTAEELTSADVVISIGCDLSGLPQPAGRLVRWDEVPPLSEDFTRADEAIRRRVSALIEELVLAESKKK